DRRRDRSSRGRCRCRRATSARVARAARGSGPARGLARAWGPARARVPAPRVARQGRPSSTGRSTPPRPARRVRRRACACSAKVPKARGAAGKVPGYLDMMVRKTAAADPLVVERVQTGVRLEKRLLKVLKALAEYHDLTLGDLLEGIVLHAFDGKSPFDRESL